MNMSVIQNVKFKIQNGLLAVQRSRIRDKGSVPQEHLHEEARFCLITRRGAAGDPAWQLIQRLLPFDLEV
jgi:hypothetical protein